MSVRRTGNPVIFEYSRALQQLRDELGRFTGEFSTRILDLMVEEAPIIEAEAKALTPVSTTSEHPGQLQRSVRVVVQQIGPHKYRMVGSAEAISSEGRSYPYDYAPIQHENTGYHHEIGQAHYLSIPFYDGIARIERRILE